VILYKLLKSYDFVVDYQNRWYNK